MSNKIEAIISLVPDAEVVVNGNTVYWHKPTIPPITEEQIQNEMKRLSDLEITNDYIQYIETHIKKIAKSKQYNDAVSLVSYVNSTNTQWKSEAETFIAWRDSVWNYAFDELQKVQKGIIQKPTIEEFINNLPKINW